MREERRMISIAIVDDEQMYLDKEKRITEEYFRRKGQECRIELFQDAEWLLCELEEKKFDIYVLDVEMPGRNGLDAAQGYSNAVSGSSHHFCNEFH